ncbi:DUF3072 domain-containing protein [Amnibacterium endophyticum]|uniref:DUF3072 domain-containing protein n=1 Tax=Amnibacterium endophyticum TaxID=2109337 RepID=A0ABW4LG64_9MICO
MSDETSADRDQYTPPQEAETLGGPEKSTTEKDPHDWVTGDEPATGAQKSYLDTLARQAGEEISADLTKAEASEHIERLQEKTGRSPS